MPAYRSDAEAAIRDAVVAKLRDRRPASRIIHEINVSGQGSNRVDVMAVGTDEIIAVEIKSEKDKLDRLATQIPAMRGAAHRVIVAMHEKFLVEQVTNKWSAHYERDGAYYMRSVPDIARGADAVWIFPERHRALDPDGYDSDSKWNFPSRRDHDALPSNAIHTLWRDELHWLCGTLNLHAGPRATMSHMLQQLRWHATGKELTLGICAALRDRKCLEADEPIKTEKVAA